MTSTPGVASIELETFLVLCEYGFEKLEASDECPPGRVQFPGASTVCYHPADANLVKQLLRGLADRERALHTERCIRPRLLPY